MNTERRKNLKVVLDTNVIISALHFGGKPAEVILLAERGVVRLYFSRFILEETKEVLLRKFDWDASRADTAVKLLGDISTVIAPLERVFAVEDEADNRILECALAAKADYLISGDNHLLKLNPYREINIVPPHTFLHELNLH